MSANLMSQPDVLHDFRDDLESSLYTLLWTTVMYSEVSDRDLVPPFLASVFNPQPYNGKGGGGKKDFLKGQSFLQDVDFPNRPALHVLIGDLARLFQIRYVKIPTGEDREAYHRLLSTLKDPYLRNTYESSNVCKQYDDGVSRLEDHAATIALFDVALSDRSKWPNNDSAMKHVFTPESPAG
jgi:hypothetical protein